MISFQRAAVSGFKWSAISQIGRQGLQLLTTVILARLLNPSDFGLIGMSTVVIGFGALFKDLGTSAAVIHRKNITEELLSSIFWVNVVFGILMTLILFFLAPFIANFYRDERLEPILKFLSIFFLISGPCLIQQAVLERELAFQKLAKVELMATLTGSLVGIGSALRGYGVWSLVYQTLATVAATSILLWTAGRWRPKLSCRWEEVKSVTDYSLNLTGFNIFNYFVRNLDYLLIGRYLGARDLGYYTIAYQIMLYPIHNISAVIGRVMFPVYSQMQEETARFRNAYLKVTGAIALVTFPMMFGLWAVVKPFVLTVFGLQWQPVIPLLMILAPVGLIQSIATTVGAIYQAKGRTDWMFRWGIGAGLIFILSFIIGLHWGIIGVAASYSIASLILVYPNFAIPFSLIDLSLRVFYRTLWRPFVACSIMMVGVLFLKNLLPQNMDGIWVLALLVPAGILIYLGTSLYMNREQIKEVVSIAGG